MTPGGPTLLFLVTEDWYFVSHRLELARRAVARGYRVVVATRVGSDGAVIRAAGCELRPLAWRRSGNTPVSHLRAYRELVVLYREVRPDIVHHVALKPVLFGSAAARRTGVPRIVNAIAGLGAGFTSRTLRARALRPLLSLLLRRALRGGDQRVIVQNRDDRDVLLRSGIVSEETVELIRGAGVDAARYGPPVAPGPGEAPTVVLVARMLWDKGVDDFVAAAAALRSRGVAARFVLVGDSDADNPSAVPRARLEAWNADGVVAWMGHRADIPEILRRAAIFCLPTRYGEGIPRSLLEAAATGLGLVVTDAPGCREVVTDGETGLLVPIGSVPQLTAAIERLLGDPALRQRLGDAARTRVLREFTLEKVIDQTLDLYRRLGA